MTVWSLADRLDYCSFIVSLEITKRESFKFVLCHTCFGFPSLWFFHKNFRTNLSISIFKKSCYSSDCGGIEPIDNLDGNWYLKALRILMNISFLALAPKPQPLKGLILKYKKITRAIVEKDGKKD